MSNPSAAGVSVTESAARRIRELIAAEGDDSLMLRVSVSSGGCSGFQLGFDLGKPEGDEDRIFEGHGVKVVIDEMSLELVKGAQLDYVDNLVGAFFKLDNPNAASSCGCGVSFSI
jgi:iron-sulfur cluster insertion protein